MQLHSSQIIAGMIAGFLLFLLFCLVFIKRNPIFKLPFVKTIAVFLLFIYGGAVAFLTLPVVEFHRIEISRRSLEEALNSIILVPIKYSLQIYNNCKLTGDYHLFIELVGGNFIMLMPLAILLPILNEKMKFFKMSLIAILVSFSIEALQLLGNILMIKGNRTVEIDDFLLNVVGCILAYIIFSVIRKIYRLIADKGHR